MSLYRRLVRADSVRWSPWAAAQLSVMLPVPWYQPRQGINFKRVSASAAMTVSEKS